MENIEQLSAHWYDEQLINQPEIIYRANTSGRWYFKKLSRSVRLFEGTTTWLKRVLPMSYGLLQWYKKNDESKIDEVLNDTSEYGTFLHIQLSTFVQLGEYDMDTIQEVVNTYETTADKSYWHEKLLNDILAFAQFMKDKNVKPIASEITLTSEAAGFRRAGTLDLPCEIDFNKKRVIAIIDIKSGSIWDEYKFQLEDYRRLWNENFPAIKAEMTFNWTSNDWRDKPTYKLVNQTLSKNEQKDFDLLFRRAKGNKVTPGKVKIAKGKLTTENISKSFKVQSLEKYHFDMLKKMEEKLDD